MTSITTESAITLEPSIQHRPTSSLIIQDLEFESNLTIAEANELAGEGPLSGAIGAVIGTASGATAGFAGYAAGQLYDGVTGGGWSWSWRAAGRTTVAGAGAGFVAWGTAALLAPAP